MMNNDRVAQFAISIELYEDERVYPLIAAMTAGMVIMSASPGSRGRGAARPDYVHYVAWHPQFPKVARITRDGKPPALPWVDAKLDQVADNIWNFGWFERKSGSYLFGAKAELVAPLTSPPFVAAPSTPIKAEPANRNELAVVARGRSE